MEYISKGSLEKLIDGESLNLPIILLVEEASVLYVDNSGSCENPSSNVRLRLSDTIDSFAGFVYKTDMVDEILPGVFVQIDKLTIEKLNENKIVCHIEKLDIFRNLDCHSHETILPRADYSCTTESVKDKNGNLPVIRLADIDLSRSRSSVLRARVLSKSAIRSYDGDQHRFFFFDVMDGSVAIRVKAFDSQCDRTFPIVVVGKLIEISRFHVVVANKKYSQVDNDYEIIIEENTTFNVLQHVNMIPMQPSFNFRPLHTLNSLNMDSLYDVIGIIKSVSPCSIVHERATQKPLSIVRLLIFDLSGDVEVVLWNEMGLNFLGVKNDVLALKAFRLRSYKNKLSLNSVMGSSLFLNPMCNDSDQLRAIICSTQHSYDSTRSDDGQ